MMKAKHEYYAIGYYCSSLRRIDVQFITTRSKAVAMKDEYVKFLIANSRLQISQRDEFFTYFTNGDTVSATPISLINTKEKFKKVYG